jgi:hypothetical protein
MLFLRLRLALEALAGQILTVRQRIHSASVEKGYGVMVVNLQLA